jgi:hypothetical protein
VASKAVSERALADIFHEVDEEVRREQLKRLWERYGTLLIAGAVLIVIGIAGWRGYQYWQNKKAAEAGAAFEAAMALSDADKHGEAQAAYDKVAAMGSSGYRLLARMRAAGELAHSDKKAAVTAYDALAADGSVPTVWRDLAALRAGMIVVDSEPFNAVQKRLDPLAEAGRPFRHTAREMLALSAWKAGDAASAKKYLDAISADAETPAGTRSRADVLSALIAGQGKG